MSAPTANDPFSFSLGQLSYIGPSYEDEFNRLHPGYRQPEPRMGARTSGQIRRVGAPAPVMQEMAMMTDRELSDIGLTRSDITRVFGPAFAASR